MNIKNMKKDEIIDTVYKARQINITDEYLWLECGDCIICSDNKQEEDMGGIYSFGNIVMVLPDCKIINIGEVIAEEPTRYCGYSKPKFHFDKTSGILTQKYHVWCDNDHHHGYIEELKTDCKYSEVLQYKADIEYLKYDLEHNFKGKYDYSAGYKSRWANKYGFDTNENGIYMWSEIAKVSTWNYKKFVLEHPTATIIVDKNGFHIEQSDGNIFEAINPDKPQKAEIEMRTLITDFLETQTQMAGFDKDSTNKETV